MKTAILIENTRIQLIFSPQSSYDLKIIDILAKLPNTHRDRFFGCQGGWTRRERGGRRELVMVFDVEIGDLNVSQDELSQMVERGVKTND
jgi:hypothetical protein